MRTLHLSIFLFLIITANVSGQSQDPYVGTTKANYPQVIQPSPEAAALGKYGDIPVSLFSGTTTVNVPIYSLKYFDAALSINLDYAATGIKVDQTATNVGLGWVLNAGGAITRSVRGLPDGANDAVYPGVNFDPTYNGSYHYLNWGGAPGSNLSNYQAALDIVMYNRDTEMDIYYFNFCGRSGKFLFDRLGVPHLIPADPKIKIQLTTSGFKIIDENGTQYFFGTTEVEQLATGVCTVGSDNPRVYSSAFTSAWYLDKIVTTTGHQLFFNYESFQFNDERNYFEVENSPPPPIDGCLDLSYLNQKCKKVAITTGKRITNIVSDDNSIKVSFLYSASPRIDLKLNGQPTGNYLSDVNITYNNNNVSTWHLQYGYFNQGLGTERLKLLSTSENNIANYTFSYNESQPLPARLSLSQDHWGYYNGKQNTSFIPSTPEVGKTTGADRESDFQFMQLGVMTKVAYPTGGYSVFQFEPHSNNITENVTTTQTSSASISVNSGDGNVISYSPVFSLPQTASQTLMQSIVLNWNLVPSNNDEVVYGYIVDASDESKIYSGVSGTGSKSIPIQYLPLGTNLKIKVLRNNVYDYGNISLTWQYPVTTPVTHNKIVYGGLRIKSIKNYADAISGNVAFEKEYEYNLLNNPQQSSIILPEECRLSYFTTSTRPNPNNGQLPCNYYVYYSNSVPEIGNHIDNSVGYTQVVEKSSSLGETGRTIYNYSSSAGLPFKANEDWHRGLLLQQEIQKYNSSDNSYTTIKKVVNTYDYSFNTSCQDFDPNSCSPNQSLVSNFQLSMVTPSYTLPYPQFDCNGPCVVAATFDYEPYKTVSVAVYLSHKQEFHYDGNSVLSNMTDYYYENPSHMLPTKIETRNSKGELIRTVTKYTADIGNDPIASNMVTNNMVSFKIEEQVLNVDKSLEEIYHVKNVYNLWQNNSFIKQQSIQTANHGLPLETEWVVNSYDIFGNPTQITPKAGVVVSYLWSYNGQYPVAKITGSDYATVSGYLTQSQIDAGTSNNASMRSTLNSLRTNLPNALIETYTYKPLVGMTSKTDPTGRTNYFEYDGFGRLNLIRDQDQNILKKYEYQYQAPSQVITYGNTALSGAYTRNNCGTGYAGGNYTTVVPANTFYSTISIMDANNMAHNYIASIGQANANTNGTCTLLPPTNLNITKYNYTSYSIYVTFLNPSTGVSTSFLMTPGTGLPLGTIAPGAYFVTFSNAGPPVSHYYMVNGVSITGSTVTIYGLSVNSNFSVVCY